MLATSEHSNSESSILPNSSALGSMACVDREGRARHLSCSVAISRRSGRQPPSSSDHHEVGRGSSRSGRNLAQDKRFFYPAYMGPSGWLGLDLKATRKVDWDEVRELLDASFRLVAPKNLIRQLDEV